RSAHPSPPSSPPRRSSDLALHLGLASARQRAARVPPMANIAVGHGHEFDVVSFRRPQDGRPSRLQFAVIGMGPEAEDAQLAVVEIGIAHVSTPVTISSRMP